MDRSVVRKRLLNPWLFRLWMWKRLPSVGFWNISVTEIDDNKCIIHLPFTWRTQNPFNSIYFSALSGASELSTGLLCQYILSELGEFSMLVVEFKAQFLKKATSSVLFSCHQGQELAAVLTRLTQKGDTATFMMTSEGHDVHGQRVAVMEITWSFRKK